MTSDNLQFGDWAQTQRSSGSQGDLDTLAAQAIATDNAFLALTPTYPLSVAQQQALVAQVAALTRQVKALIRLQATGGDTLST